MTINITLLVIILVGLVLFYRILDPPSPPQDITDSDNEEADEVINENSSLTHENYSD